MRLGGAPYEGKKAVVATFGHEHMEDAQALVTAATQIRWGQRILCVTEHLFDWHLLREMDACIRELRRMGRDGMPWANAICSVLLCGRLEEGAARSYCGKRGSVEELVGGATKNLCIPPLRSAEMSVPRGTFLRRLILPA